MMASVWMRPIGLSDSIMQPTKNLPGIHPQDSRPFVSPPSPSGLGFMWPVDDQPPTK